MYVLYGYTWAPKLWANIWIHYLINAILTCMDGPSQMKAKNGLRVPKRFVLEVPCLFFKKNSIFERGRFWVIEHLHSPQKSLLNLAFFGQKIATFGDFWLYVKISGSFTSVVLKKNDVVKGPIWQYAWVLLKKLLNSWFDEKNFQWKRIYRFSTLCFLKMYHFYTKALLRVDGIGIWWKKIWWKYFFSFFHGVLHAMQ